VIDRLVDAAETHGAAAQAAAVVAARDAAPSDRRSLEKAVAAWHAALDRAVMAMQEWQSLAELTLSLRKLIEHQEDVVKGTTGLQSRDRSGAAPQGGPKDGNDRGGSRDGKRDGTPDGNDEGRPPAPPGPNRR